MSAAILLNSLGWLPVAATLAIAAAAFLFWSYKTSRIRGKWRWICVALKGLSIIALALCLLEPLWVTQRSRSGANFFLLLADNSRSLEIQDQGSSESRAQSLKRTLNEDGIEWQAQLAKDFQLRRYLFDSRLTRVETFSKLDFEGRSSGLHSALTGIKERFNGQPLAGVLLFSDGNATDLPGP
ncbi:MAG: hypothetical protein FJ405_16400, partial [Verrucomicrobia bacterium]|nr:hypothetical protein [Verrucomicrobiota bacterium]